LLIFDLEPPGNAVAMRPSGTEPKLKCYLFAYRPPEESGDLKQAEAESERQLREMEEALPK
jgi:phosphoglucomutase/phosphomannomutase